jgi:hypothetical protein
LGQQFFGAWHISVSDERFGKIRETLCLFVDGEDLISHFIFDFARLCQTVYRNANPLFNELYFR